MPQCPPGRGLPQGARARRPRLRARGHPRGPVTSGRASAVLPGSQHRHVAREFSQVRRQDPQNRLQRPEPHFPGCPAATRQPVAEALTSCWGSHPTGLRNATEASGPVTRDRALARAAQAVSVMPPPVAESWAAAWAEGKDVGGWVKVHEAGAGATRMGRRLPAGDRGGPWTRRTEQALLAAWRPRDRLPPSPVLPAGRSFH